MPIPLIASIFVVKTLNFSAASFLAFLNIARQSLHNLSPLEIFHSKPNKTSLRIKDIFSVYVEGSRETSTNFSWVSKLLSTQSIKHIASCSLLETSEF